MKCKIYATDEGFGPLVRQSAIIEELLALDPGLDINFQTHAHLDAARWILSGVSFQDRFNNITWNKHPDASPNVEAIREVYRDYETRSDAFLRAELDEFDYDFVISDFVFEGFQVAHRQRVPSFGVAHFTWDWFFSKMFPVPLSSAVLDRFHAYASRADVLYFPPFTPREILKRYADRAMEVPLVVRKQELSVPVELDEAKFQVLVIDSGSQVLREQMRRALRDAGGLSDFHFFVSSSLGVTGENITAIPEKEMFVDHIPHVDLVIARAGFNTISECIAFRTPMLLVGEAMNPEMSENMMNIKHEGLGSFVSLDHFTRRFNRLLPEFVDREYGGVLQAMREHEIGTDGAAVIADDILNRVGGRIAAPSG